MVRRRGGSGQDEQQRVPTSRQTHLHRRLRLVLRSLSSSKQAAHQLVVIGGAHRFQSIRAGQAGSGASRDAYFRE